MIFIGAIIIIVQSPQPQPESEVVPEPVQPVRTPGMVVQCPRCGWSGAYETTTKARQALGAHKRFCKGQNVRISPFAKPF